jgi:hypothetical protein
VAIAVVALALAATLGVGRWRGSHDRNVRIAQLLKTAATQSTQTKYQSAFDSYQQILSLDPTHRAALDGQVDAAMSWLENYRMIDYSQAAIARLSP